MIIQKAIHTLGLITMLLSLSFGVTSCSDNDNNNKKTNEQSPPIHEETKVASVTLKLAAGHFHGVRFHQDNQIEGLKYLNALQEIRLNYNNGKWEVAQGSPSAFYVKASTSDTPGAYGLWITYLAENGDTLNSEFIDNGADKFHQHFFNLSNAKGFGTYGQDEADDNDTQKMFSYTYMDTTPWNKTLNTGATLNDRSNPIGFKGYFYFYKARKQFTLNIELRHARTNKVINGVVSPFYAPTTTLRANSEVEQSFSVQVYTLHNLTEETNWVADSDTPISDLNEDERRIIQAVAEGYGISFEEAFRAFVYRIENPGQHDLNSGLYF